jgi:hypothetical protein
MHLMHLFQRISNLNPHSFWSNCHYTIRIIINVIIICRYLKHHVYVPFHLIRLVSSESLCVSNTLFLLSVYLF